MLRDTFYVKCLTKLCVIINVNVTNHLRQKNGCGCGSKCDRRTHEDCRGSPLFWNKQIISWGRKGLFDPPEQQVSPEQRVSTRFLLINSSIIWTAFSRNSIFTVTNLEYRCPSKLLRVRGANKLLKLFPPSEELIQQWFVSFRQLGPRFPQPTFLLGKSFWIQWFAGAQLVP